MKIAKPKPGKPITGSRDSKKYTDFRANDKSGRNGTIGKKPEGQYWGGGPRVGGTASKPTSIASGTGSKKVINKAVKNIKRTAASPQAKKAARRAYDR